MAYGPDEERMTHPNRTDLRWLRHLTTLLVIAAFAALGAGTTGSDEDGGDESSEENNPGAAARRDLESHLSNGQAYGDGPGGAQIASSMREMLDQEMGDALAVRVVPGNPERIVALLRLRDLRDFSDSDRQEWLDSFGETIRDGFGATDSHIVVGIRGNVFFGAVAVMTPTATAWDVETGTVVSTTAIDDALGATAAPAAPTDPRQDVYGEIQASDPPYQGEYASRPADRISVTVPAGQNVTVTMNSPILDPYLYVLDPAGEVVAENDDHDNLNSRVDFVPAAAGAYTVVATTFEAGDTGAYVIRTRVGGAAPPAAPAEGEPAAEAPAEAVAE